MSDHDFGDDTDFNPPPENYKTDDPPTYKCRAEVKCPSCGKNHGDCDIITDRMKAEEDDEVINRGNRSNDQQPQQGNGRRRQRNGLPFLSPRECSTNPQPATVVVASVGPHAFRRGEEQVNMRIRFKGKDYTFGLRENNPNLDTLCDAWGEDETQWAGKEMEVYNHEDPATGTVFVQFDPGEMGPAEEEKVSSGRGRKRGS